MRTGNIYVFCLLNNRLFGLGDFHIPDYHRPWPFMGQQRGTCLHFFSESPFGQLEERSKNPSPALYGGYLPTVAFNDPGRRISLEH